MTGCNCKPLVFSSLARRKVVADFVGGAITSDSMASLLREVDRKLGLIDSLDAVIPDPRNPALITHQQVTMLRQRIFAIALGYEDPPHQFAPARQIRHALCHNSSEPQDRR